MDVDRCRQINDLNIERDRARLEFFPPGIIDVYIESDIDCVAFKASAKLSESGAQFGPDLGEMGGY